MAVYPCSLGEHRYGGAQRSLYLTSVKSSRPVSRKLRLCQRHCENLFAQAEGRMDQVTDDGQMSLVCQWDGCSGTRSDTVFARFFMGGDEGVQFASDLCDVHAPELLSLLGWESGVEM